jgi:hypothetical protein
MAVGEAAQQRRQEAHRVVVRAAEAQHAAERILGQVGQGLVVQGQQALGVFAQALARRGQPHAAAGAQQRGWPTTASSRCICRLSADWVRCTRWAARLSVPLSATASQLRSRSMSRLAGTV